MSYEVTFQAGALSYTARGPDTAGLLALIQGLQGTEVVPEHELRRDAAEATLQRLKYKWCGGKLWAPPIGPAPAFLDDIQSGWIDWSGGHRPVRDHAKVTVQTRSGATIGPCPAHELNWGHASAGLMPLAEIVRYRTCE